MRARIRDNSLQVVTVAAGDADRSKAEDLALKIAPKIAEVS
jgi:hypothetical protein